MPRARRSGSREDVRAVGRRDFLRLVAGSVVVDVVVVVVVGSVGVLSSFLRRWSAVAVRRDERRFSSRGGMVGCSLLQLE